MSNETMKDGERAAFEAWWYEREVFGLRAERLNTPDAAARAAWMARAAAPQAALTNEPIAWRYTLYVEDQAVSVRFEESRMKSPFGKKGVNFDPSATVEETALYVKGS